MILILLIVAAAACVVAGVLSESLVLAYIALGLAVLGAAVFGFAALRERKSRAADYASPEKAPESSDAAAEVNESTEVAEADEATARVDAVDDEKSIDDEKSPVAHDASSESTAANDQRISTNGHASVPSNDVRAESKAGVTPVASAVAVEESFESNRTVYVIPGRKRFHVVGCHILDGRSYEELTFADAEDEGFTACTSCSTTRQAE